MYLYIMLYLFCYTMKDKTILFRVDRKEHDLILKKSKKFKFRSVSEYCRFVSMMTKDISVNTKVDKRLICRVN